MTTIDTINEWASKKSYAILQRLSRKPSNVMTPSHPRWDEFVYLLGGQSGCNFREENGETRWDCDGSRDRPMAREILRIMGMDIESSFAYFDDHGGYCDCEILYNVQP